MELVAALEYNIIGTEIRVVGKNSKSLSRANGFDPHDRAVGKLTEGRTFIIRTTVFDFDAISHIEAFALIQSGPGALGHKILTGESEASLERHPGSAFCFARFCANYFHCATAEKLYEIAQKGQKKLNTKYSSPHLIEQERNYNSQTLAETKAVEQSSDAEMDIRQDKLAYLRDRAMNIQMTMIRDDGTEEPWGDYNILDFGESGAGGAFSTKTNIVYKYRRGFKVEPSKEIPRDFMEFVHCLREFISILSTEGREKDVEFCKARLEVLEREGAQYVEAD